MTDQLPSVALIVVAFHHAAHLPATLAALDQLDYPADRRETIVVENGDGDSAAIARSAGARVIEPGRNLGFAAGCNAAARATSADVIVLINPDLQPRRPFLRAIVAPLSDPQIGVVGAKLLLPDARTIQHAGGWLREPSLLTQHHGYGALDRGQHDEPRDLSFVTGAALAMRRSDWDALGGMDEAFFPAYYEDVDLCLRAVDRGLRVRYEPRAVALHHEAAGLGKASAAYHELFHRNRLRLIFKRNADADVIHAWLPAELAHLRATADDAEIAALLRVYLWWQAELAGVDHGLSKHNAPAAPPDDETAELAWVVHQITAKRSVTPLPFRSRWPLVARVRRWLSRIVVEEYARPLTQQQNDFNASVADLAVALERQRRATDAAIACQGMLLAKLIRRSANEKA